MSGWVITGLVDRPSTSPRTDRLTEFRARLRHRRRARAARAHSMRMSGNDVRFLPGSEHSHMLRRRGF
jgi:hypothetical protein